MNATPSVWPMRMAFGRITCVRTFTGQDYRASTFLRQRRTIRAAAGTVELAARAATTATWSCNHGYRLVTRVRPSRFAVWAGQVVSAATWSATSAPPVERQGPTCTMKFLPMAKLVEPLQLLAGERKTSSDVRFLAVPLFLHGRHNTSDDRFRTPGYVKVMFARRRELKRCARS